MPDRLGGEVQRALSRLGPGGAIADVVAAWPEAVGESIARNAWPARIARDGTLHVHTSSSAWAFELGMLEADVCRRLAEALGAGAAPTKLRFAPGRLPEPAPSEEKRLGRAPPAVTAQHAKAGDELAAAISDENLRKVVARAAAASLAGRRDDRRV